MCIISYLGLHAFFGAGGSLEIFVLVYLGHAVEIDLNAMSLVDGWKQVQFAGEERGSSIRVRSIAPSRCSQSALPHLPIPDPAVIVSFLVQRCPTLRKSRRECNLCAGNQGQTRV